MFLLMVKIAEVLHNLFLIPNKFFISCGTPIYTYIKTTYDQSYLFYVKHN
jgi:hypothetical protein